MSPSIRSRQHDLGVKGLGELGMCGSGTARAHAVYNSTGVRDFPITTLDYDPHQAPNR